MAPAKCRMVFISPVGAVPAMVLVLTGAIPVVDILCLLGFGMDFQGDITPWRPRNPTIVQMVVHCLARVGLSAYLGAVTRAILVSILPMWRLVVELWGYSPRQWVT